jgi:hypothetical protein
MAVTLVTDSTALSDTIGSHIFVAAIIASTSLGISGKLPLMQQNASRKTINFSKSAVNERQLAP